MFKFKAFWQAGLVSLCLIVATAGSAVFAQEETPPTADQADSELSTWADGNPEAPIGEDGAPLQIDETSEQTAASPYPAVLDARVSATPDRARLVVDLAGPTEFAIASLDGPNRIAIDVRATSVPNTPPNPVAGDGLVSSFAVTQPEANRVRTMLVINGYAQVQQAYILEPFEGQPARLVVDLIPATEAEFTTRVVADLAAAQNAQTPEQGVQATTPGQTTAQPQTRPLVIIDPGHGGVDNGASATNGAHEKDIVLAFSLKLQELLIASNRFDVALTRSDDTFIKLEDRVAVARLNRADLFVSIHADSFQQPEIRGASIYTRDPLATDDLDRILAEQENKADLIAGIDMPEIPSAVVDILVDLLERETRRQSFIAAETIVDQLEPSIALRRFPTRQANFVVLQAPDVPSVLVELGFLSNAEDIANLTQGDWQTRTAEALARGIAAYFDTVDQQRALIAAGP